MWHLIQVPVQVLDDALPVQRDANASEDGPSACVPVPAWEACRKLMALVLPLAEV